MVGFREVNTRMVNGVSIIIPLCNGAQTLVQTLNSLAQQIWTAKLELLLINDCSTDGSVALALAHPIAGNVPIRVIPNERGGTSEGCNLGVEQAQYEYLIMMHQDCYLPSPTAIQELMEPFSDPAVVAVMSLNQLPAEDWDKMSFWDKVANARYAEQIAHGLGGKFDGLRRDAVQRIGGYDSHRFFSAGDDWDLLIRLSAIGEVARSSASVIHAHCYPPKTQLASLFRKQIQLGQGFGAVIRKSFPHLPGFTYWQIFLLHLSKLALCCLLFVPSFTFVALSVLLIMGIVYSWRALFVRDWRVPLVPFVVAAQLVVFSFSFLMGLLYGRQRFDYAIRDGTRTPAITKTNSKD